MGKLGLCVKPGDLLRDGQHHELVHRNALLLGITFGFVLCACGRDSPSGNRSAVAPDTSSCTVSNPIADGEDPWVVRRNDWYYLVESTGGGISVYRSKKLTDLKRNEVPVWSAPEEGWNQSHIWAPELHFVNGRWYIYYAAGRAGPPFIHQRSGVLQSVADDPQGEYRSRCQLYTGDNLSARTGRFIRLRRPADAGLPLLASRQGFGTGGEPLRHWGFRHRFLRP